MTSFQSNKKTVKIVAMYAKRENMKLKSKFTIVDHLQQYCTVYNQSLHQFYRNASLQLSKIIL